MSRILPARVGNVAQTPKSRLDIREACMLELMASDGASAMQEAAVLMLLMLRAVAGRPCTQ